MNTFEEEQPPEITPIDELFQLKNSLVSSNTLSKNHLALSKQILEILEDHPDTAKTLLSWEFPERELLYLFRSGHFHTAISLATLIIKETRTIPPVYLSKPFLFFITSKLSQSPEFNKSTGIRGIKSEDILNFATEMILINRETARALHDSGFFILAAALITSECCRLYASIFVGIEYYEGSIPETAESAVRPPLQGITTGRSGTKMADAVYEIHRKQFDPEIILYEQEVFGLVNLQTNYRTSVFSQIYTNCKNLYHLIEQDTQAMLDVMLYKRITYLNETLLLLVAEKNPKAVKYYRRALEAGVVPDESLINPLVQMLDQQDICLDAVICLYYYIRCLNSDGSIILQSHKGFNRNRIRSIFQCLEFRCTAECQKSEEDEYNKNNRVLPSFSESALQDNLLSHCSEPIDSFKKPGDLSQETTRMKECKEEKKKTVPSLCNRSRIITLLKNLYKWVPHEHFYAPSYLILMKSCTLHCNDEIQFIREYFEGFLAYISENKLNVARVFFPPQKEKKRRDQYVEITMDDACYDEGNEVAYDEEYINKEELSAFMKNIQVSNNEVRLDKKGRIIESDEDS